MSEANLKKRRAILIAAAVLAVPTFGAGFWLGRSYDDATALSGPTVDDANAEATAIDPLDAELAACQRKLARRIKARAIESATAVRPDEAAQDAGAPQRRMERLEKEIKSCRQSELLHGAEICRTVRPHLDALLGLPKNDVLCIQRVRVSDYIADDFDKCAAFDPPPAEADLVGYTDEERKTILDAVEVAKTLDEDKLTELLNGVHQGCYGVPGMGRP